MESCGDQAWRGHFLFSRLLYPLNDAQISLKTPKVKDITRGWKNADFGRCNNLRSAMTASGNYFQLMSFNVQGQSLFRAHFPNFESRISNLESQEWSVSPIFPVIDALPQFRISNLESRIRAIQLTPHTPTCSVLGHGGLSTKPN